MKPRILVCFALVGAALSGLMACGNRGTGPLQKITAKASAGATARAEMTANIVQGVQAKTFGIGNVIDAAQKKLDAAAAGSSGASKDQAESQAATAFAGAVLDAVAQLEGTLPNGGEHELFWMQVGRLAFKASEEAFANQRLAEAGSLVLGGGKRWQNDAYWQRYSDHDGLTSAIMAAQGNRSGAIERLQNRADLSGVALEVYQSLTGR